MIFSLKTPKCQSKKPFCPNLTPQLLNIWGVSYIRQKMDPVGKVFWILQSNPLADHIFIIFIILKLLIEQYLVSAGWGRRLIDTPLRIEHIQKVFLILVSLLWFGGRKYCFNLKLRCIDLPIMLEALESKQRTHMTGRQQKCILGHSQWLLQICMGVLSCP